MSSITSTNSIGRFEDSTFVGRIELFPVKCDVKTDRFDLAKELKQAIKKNRIALKDGDILVVSSKYAAVSQGRIADLNKVKVSKEARHLSRIYSLKPELAQLVLEESDSILGGVKGYLLAMSDGILAPNAGIDLSNCPRGFAVLQPSNPERLAAFLRQRMMSAGVKSGASRLGVIFSDSRITPARLGTVGIAIASAGIRKTIDLRGAPDLFQNELKVTLRALADQLATAAELLMGETNEGVPLVMIRGIEDAFETPATELEKISAIPEDRCLIISGLRHRYRKRSRL